MSLVCQLVGFGLRQVIGDYADGPVQIAAAVEQHFRDPSRTLPKALGQAHQRAWQALGVALAGDGLLDRVKVFFASGDDKGVREQVQLFLQGNAVSFDGAPADFRRDCLDELKRLRKSGMLSTAAGSTADIARQAACFRRHADPQGLIEESRRAVAGVADALAEGYPNLARLLRAPTPAGPPLLAAAFCYFFRREVETNGELAHGLFFDGLRQLSASQDRAFGEVGKALSALGGQFDAVFEQLDRVEAAVVDVQAEQQRQGGLHLAMAGEIRILREQVQQLLTQAGMARGVVQSGDSCAIRSPEERQAVKALLARFRRLPAEEQRRAPDLLNGLGKLQVGAGDLAEARRTFAEVVKVVGDPSGKAEASFNAYQAALEEKQWEAALAALREAGSHDQQRFSPFPLHRYEPKRILGAGGFGTAFLCRDLYLKEDVVVKTLHAADLTRSMDEVFSEARILRQLSHPAIIGVRTDCDYADTKHKGRPYLVMDFFPGTTLQEFVEERGPLGLEQLLAVAVQVAEGMKAAHDQGILHRDLKPANILVRKEGDRWVVKIIDFGLALRQQTVEKSKVSAGATPKNMLDRSVAGTLDYAPPEQLGKLPGVKPGPYSDVYAFARTCCYAMFRATELLPKQWKSLPGPLADLLESCLARDHGQRPNGFERVLAVLGECSRGGQETRLREQEERLRREQEEEQRRQREGEEQLSLLVRAALDRTGGKPTADDTAKAKELCRRHRLPSDRANAVVRAVKEAWRQAREEQEREQKRREIARLQQEQDDERRRAEELRSTEETWRHERDLEEWQRQEEERRQEEEVEEKDQQLYGPATMYVTHHERQEEEVEEEQQPQPPEAVQREAVEQGRNQGFAPDVDEEHESGLNQDLCPPAWGSRPVQGAVDRGSSIVTCPNCNVTLKPKTPLPAGTRIKCPKCQTVFAVPADGATAPAPSPMAAPTSAEDDDAGFGGMSDDPAERWGAASRPVKKGVPWWVWLMGGSATLLLGCCGVCCGLGGYLGGYGSGSVTHVNYNKIEKNMSEAQIQSILGEHRSKSEASGNKVVTWQDGENVIAVTFADD